MIDQPQNNVRIIKGLVATPENARRGFRRGFDRIGRELVAHNRNLIRKGPKTGKLYRIAGRRRRHRASAPGEPPANLTGNLARSIGFQINTVGDEMAFGTRSPDDPRGGVEYGAFLDQGTRKIEPRPHVTKTVEDLDDRVETVLNEEIMKAI
jgi:hypothetical protein